MARPTNGTGQGGKSMQDRELAASVRSLGLEEIKYILLANGTSPEAQKQREKLARKKIVIPKAAKNKKLYETVVSNLSKTILPRLNEHTGPDGGPMEIKGVTISVRRQ